MKLIDLLGAAGGILLAFCAAPQAIKAIKDKHSNGLSHGLIWLWLLGELFMFIYIILKYIDYWLILNYVMSLIFISIITYFDILPYLKVGDSRKWSFMPETESGLYLQT